MSSTVTAITTREVETDPSTLIQCFCIIVYVEGIGFQMHPVEERLNATGSSILIDNRHFYRTTDPVFLAPPENWSPCTVTMASEIRGAGFCGEAYFTHSEQGLVMLATLWWFSLTEADYAGISELPVNTAS